MWGAVAGAIGTVLTGYLTSQAQKKAANTASNAQQAMASQSIEEQRAAFERMHEILSPYIDQGMLAATGLTPYQKLGQQALNSQADMLGLNGSNAQQQYIQGLQNSPEMAAKMQYGENAILQNASATGGLRGGNTQAALAQFRPQLLAQTMQDQYNRLGGLAAQGMNANQNLAAMGQNSAAALAGGNQNMANNVGNIYDQQGNGLANQALTMGQSNIGLYNALNSAYNGLTQSYINQQQQPTNNFSNQVNALIGGLK